MESEAPRKKKRSKLSKTIDLVLRYWHVGTSSVLFGGMVLGIPFERLGVWHTLAIVTGGSLVLSGICQSRHWSYQVRGLLAFTHVGLLALVHFQHDWVLPVLTAVLLCGFLGSNLPGNLRHWSVLHGERVD
ncbi:hypothetical protein GMLC_26220 [Geomonas limicola]|uniref:Uncharacterized protein n=1 Tax=Geomonas limicola TaxID=2740186 RepID=A0A6V8NBX6_9BACT|nr:hypothetical protein [Geomonas limicola]GFO69043.1 hypothetical protein GMLC_26220 [Geomonas limicola]